MGAPMWRTTATSLSRTTTHRRLRRTPEPSFFLRSYPPTRKRASWPNFAIQTIQKGSIQTEGIPPKIDPDHSGGGEP